MPMVTTTVTPAMRETIANLNRLLRAREEQEIRPTRGGSHEPPERHAQPVCDACAENLGRRCVNVVIDPVGATSNEGEPMPDGKGRIVIRYHIGCYAGMSEELPKHDHCDDLTKWINDGYGRRRKSIEEEANA